MTISAIELLIDQSQGDQRPHTFYRSGFSPLTIPTDLGGSNKYHADTRTVQGKQTATALMSQGWRNHGQLVKMLSKANRKDPRPAVAVSSVLRLFERLQNLRVRAVSYMSS